MENDDEVVEEIIVNERDDGESSSEEEDPTQVFLGFIDDEVDDEGDGSEHESDDEFPSHIGGLPHWLLKQGSTVVSDQDDLFTCPSCGEPFVMMCEVYAPLDWLSGAYHRFLHVFSCPRASCWKGSVTCARVVRSQLPKDAALCDSAQLSLCQVCGKPASKKCSQCRTAKYCCRSHQAADWKAGHKEACSNTDPSKASSSSPLSSDPLFVVKSMPIVTEAEDYQFDPEVFEELADAQSALVVNSNRLPSKIMPSAANEAKLSEDANTKPDSVFLRFQARTRDYPDQVLRYAFGAKRPLWVNAERQLVGDAPKCEQCGARRVFEMQLMPQLLFFLNVDQNEDLAVDWSSLVIYSCEKSCNAPPGKLATEYIFVH